MKLHQEGVPAELIDNLAEKIGMPMGPIELSDTVGLDICQAVAEEMISAFGGESGISTRQKALAEVWIAPV